MNDRLRLALREAPRWLAILGAPRGAGVSYGVERVPGPDEIAIGGQVKFQLLAETLPNRPRGFDLLYLGSSTAPADARVLVRLARLRRAAFVWNQNGVAYPGWFGPGYERFNRLPARLLHAADHVVFQSAFCKQAADRFYGERREPWEILPNPVDVERFTPAPARPERPLTLVLGGSQYQRYRLESALAVLARLPEARLVVTGALSWAPSAPAEAAAIAADLGVEERVEYVGAYSQAEAPDVLRRGDLLLHTKVNDPCPTVVLEAMACGLPVVYAASGGTPELVGDEAGIGVPAPLDWEVDRPADPDLLAGAVREAAARLAELSAAARARSLRFDARAWVARHVELFDELRRRRRPPGRSLSSSGS